MYPAFLRFRSAHITPACALLLTASLLSGCSVSVDKSANGKDKNVQMETPFGGLHVRSDDTTAANLGLPTYPGAQVVPDSDGDKSADVSLGFGEWQLRVKAVNYRTSDSRDKVVDFYRKALAQFGEVLTCNNDQPVGKPTVTSQGLTCKENDVHTHVDLHNSNGFNLRAGSRHHQRIVGFEDHGSAETRFSLVELVLPVHLDENHAKTD